MKTKLRHRVKMVIAAGGVLFACHCAFAQEPVVAAADADGLFTSPDPRLNTNKQVVYHIVRDLLEANHWELADRYLTREYRQHNPNVESGRDAVVRFFVDVLKLAPTPIPAKMKTPVVSVTAEGDLVLVATPRMLKDKSGALYTTTAFDMWRIKDGKADEHWDAAARIE